jgi:hypothetical protein
MRNVRFSIRCILTLVIITIITGSSNAVAEQQTTGGESLISVYVSESVIQYLKKLKTNGVNAPMKKQNTPADSTTTVTL